MLIEEACVPAVRSRPESVSLRLAITTMLAVVGVLALTATASADTDFSDVPSDSTFATEIAWLAESGITQGRGDGTFGVGDPVTRGAMAAFLYRSAGEPTDATALREIAGGSGYTCALDDDGSVWCWGALTSGENAFAPPTLTVRPTRIDGVDDAVRLEAAASDTFVHSCAILADGSVTCWGEGNPLQPGWRTEGFVPDPRPITVPDVTGAQELTVGGNHACALDGGGQVWCWGENIAGAIGVDENQHQVPPTRLDALGVMSDIDAGAQHTCSVDRDGGVWCWGDNGSGKSGQPLDEPRSHVPRQVAGLPAVTEVAAGRQHTCARTVDGEVWCWGSNRFGELGAGTGDDRPQPVRIDALSGVRQLSTAGAHTCAVDASGDAWCWGHNVAGQLGDGTELREGTSGGSASSPRRVIGVPAIAAIAPAAGNHSCALDTSGRAWCWGDNGAAQLGRGDAGGRDAVAAPVVSFG